MKILIILSLAATCLAGRAKTGNAQNAFQHAGKPKSDKGSFVVSWGQLDDLASINPNKNGNTEKRSEDFSLTFAGHGFQGPRKVGPSGVVVQPKASVIPENPSFIENPKEVLEKEKSSSEESQESESSSQSFDAEKLIGKKESSSSESSSQSSSEETNANVTTVEVSPSQESNATAVNQKEENTDSPVLENINQEVNQIEDTNSPVVAENIEEDNDAPAKDQKESPKPIEVNAEPKAANKNEYVPFDKAFQPFVRSTGFIHKNRVRDVDTRRPQSVKAQRPSRRLLRSSDFGIEIRNEAQSAKVREPQGRIQSRNRYVQKQSRK